MDVVSPLLAVGILPGLEALFKSVLLGAVVIVTSVVNATIAVPIGIIVSRRYWRTGTRGRRILAGVIVAFAAFGVLWIGEVVVLALLVDKYLVHGST